eukprot:352099-Chlamydomonas_euryale.AAC.1
MAARHVLAHPATHLDREQIARRLFAREVDPPKRAPADRLEDLKLVDRHPGQPAARRARAAPRRHRAGHSMPRTGARAWPKRGRRGRRRRWRRRYVARQHARRHIARLLQELELRDE